MKKMRAAMLLLAFLTACSQVPVTGSLPPPASAVVGSFIWQTDGVCGYRMLRPQAWQASNGECRFYNWTGAGNPTDRLALQAINYQVTAEQMSDGLLIQYGLFQQNPSLDEWTRAIGQSWASDGIQFTKLESPPLAKIFLLNIPHYTNAQIVAFVIDGNQPLGIGLTASGAYANLDRLQKEHILDDFKVMLASIRAISYDPHTIDPPLGSH